MSDPYTDFRHQLIAETAGLFWLLAETVILAYIVYARRRLESPANHTAAPGWRAIAATSIGLCLLVYGRHLIITPVYALDTTLADTAYQHAVKHRYRVHMSIWATLVLAWVILEAAIVYHGWRCYRILRTRLT